MAEGEYIIVYELQIGALGFYVIMLYLPVTKTAVYAFGDFSGYCPWSLNIFYKKNVLFILIKSKSS